MKRDMNIIRCLLDSMEKDDYEELKKYKEDEVAYQAELLIDAGFVEGKVTRINIRGRTKPDKYHLTRLTWKGHEFLDASRDSKIWELAKKHVLKPGSSWTFSLLLEFLKSEAQKHLSR